MSRRWEQDLEVPLKQPEIAERAKELSNKCLKAAHTESKIEEIKQQAKDDVKVLAGDLEVVRERIKELARTVRKGVEMRAVMVEAKVHSNQVDIVRMDTGAIVESRPLTEEDRQMELDDVLARIEQDTKTAEEQDEDEEPEDEEGEEDDAAS